MNDNNKNTYTKLVGQFDKLIKCSEISIDNHSWMNVLLEETLDGLGDLSSEDDN